MFLLVPAYPGSPGQTAVKWLLLLLLLLYVIDYFRVQNVSKFHLAITLVKCHI